MRRQRLFDAGYVTQWVIKVVNARVSVVGYANQQGVVLACDKRSAGGTGTRTCRDFTLLRMRETHGEGGYARQDESR